MIPTEVNDVPIDSNSGRDALRELAALKVHAAVFAVSMSGIFLTNLFVNLAAEVAGRWSAWWSAWAFLGWGFGVSLHALVVWMVRQHRPIG